MIFLIDLEPVPVAELSFHRLVYHEKREHHQHMAHHRHDPRETGPFVWQGVAVVVSGQLVSYPLLEVEVELLWWWWW